MAENRNLNCGHFIYLVCVALFIYSKRFDWYLHILPSILPLEQSKRKCLVQLYSYSQNNQMKQKVLKKVIQSILDAKPNAPVEKKYNFDLSIQVKIRID